MSPCDTSGPGHLAPEEGRSFEGNRRTLSGCLDKKANLYYSGRKVVGLLLLLFVTLWARAQALFFQSANLFQLSTAQSKGYHEDFLSKRRLSDPLDFLFADLDEGINNQSFEPKKSHSLAPTNTSTKAPPATLHHNVAEVAHSFTGHHATRETEVRLPKVVDEIGNERIDAETFKQKSALRLHSAQASSMSTSNVKSLFGVEPRGSAWEGAAPKEHSFAILISKVKFLNQADEFPDVYGQLKVYGAFGTEVFWSYRPQNFLKNVAAMDLNVQIYSLADRVCFLGEVFDKDVDRDHLLAHKDQRVCGSGGVARLEGEFDGMGVEVEYGVYRVSLPTMCRSRTCRYMVLVTNIDFINPGESGEPEPYGYVDVYHGEEAERVWSRAHGDMSFSTTEANFKSRFFDAESSTVCFSGHVKDNDGGYAVNGDDVLALPSSISCGTGGMAKLDGEVGFWRQKSYTYVHYQVYQLEPLKTQELPK